MTLAQAPDRPREPSGRRPLWIALTLAVLAVVVAAVVVLGGRSRPRSEAQGRGPVQLSTPAEDAAGAVDAVPTAEAVGPNTFGGPGSAADGTIGFAQTQQPAQAVAAEEQARPRQRPRRAAARRRENTPPAEQPSYRTVGPAADEAPPPQT